MEEDKIQFIKNTDLIDVAKKIKQSEEESTLSKKIAITNF